MISYFVKNIEKYSKIIVSNSKLQGKKLKSGIYSMRIDYCDYEALKEKIDILYSEFDNLICN